MHMAQLMPLPLTVSCFSKIQIGFTVLVPAHPGSPGQRAVKRACVCVRDLIDRYMYSDALSVTQWNVVQVLQGARKYQLNGLTRRCVEFVETSLTDDGVCAVLEHALTTNEHAVVDACLHHVEQRTGGVFQSPGFLDAAPQVLARIVCLDTLDVTELDLFHACVAWAHHRATTTTSQPTKVNRGVPVVIYELSSLLLA